MYELGQADHALSDVRIILERFMAATARCSTLLHALVGNIAGFGHAVAKSDDRRARGETSL